jgi:hypothetical protein
LLLRRAALFLLFCLALLATGLFVGWATDDKGYVRYRPWISEKLHVLQNADAATNAVFIGASTVTRELNPAIFDSAAAEAGCTIHSINLGFPAARVYELAFMLDQVLERGLPKGTFVLYDVTAPFNSSYEDIVQSDRRPVAARLAYASDVAATTLRSRFRATFNFTRAALGRMIGLHSLNDLLFKAAWHRPIAALLSPESLGERGFTPVEGTEDHNDDARVRREEFLTPEGQAEFQELMAKWSTASASGRFKPNPFAERIRAAGMVPVAFAAPHRLPDIAKAAEIAKAGDPDLAVISFTKESYPELFGDPVLWFDRGHLALAGAAIASRSAGRSLCKIMKGS